MANNDSILHGRITPTIISFSIPIIIGSLVQVMFNMADQIVLGQMAGTVAVAAVGACGTVCTLIVNFFCGLAGGVTILLARFLGAGETDNCRKCLSTSVITSVLIGLLGMGIALPLAGPLLRVTDCPAECFDGAYTYLFIYYCAVPSIVLYNFGSAVLRVSGDSRRPMVYLILSGILNVVLNVVLCFLLEQKVAAVAIATLASQTLGAVLVLVRLIKMPEDWRLNLKTLIFDSSLFRKMMRYGIPSAFNNSLFCLANLQTQSAINSFGTEAVAGYSAACNITNIPGSIQGALNVTAMTMIGQNLGARQDDRVRKSYFRCALFSAAACEALGLLIYLFRIPLMRLYVPESENALIYGTYYMLHVTVLEAICAFNGINGSFLNSFGYTNMTLTTSILCTIVFRTIWIQLVFPHVGTFPFVMATFTMAWLLCLLFNGIATAVVYRRFRKGIVRKL